MEAVATPVATDSAVLTRADIKLEVLNATGKAGVAKEKAKIFEDLGYKDIKVGNSTENITGNQIYILKGSKEKLSVLLQDADEKLDIASIAGELADLTTDAKIIIGK